MRPKQISALPLASQQVTKRRKRLCVLLWWWPCATNKKTRERASTTASVLVFIGGPNGKGRLERPKEQANQSFTKGAPKKKAVIGLVSERATRLFFTWGDLTCCFVPREPLNDGPNRPSFVSAAWCNFRFAGCPGQQCFACACAPSHSHHTWLAR